jgi:hypothetical protein
MPEQPTMNNNLYLETVDPKNEITTLLNNELKRLEAKQKVIDPLYDTKLRQNSQLRSMTLRKNALTHIFLVVVFIIGLCVSLFILKNYFPILPDLLVDSLLTVVIGGGIIYVVTLFINFSNRDLSDFEKLDYGTLMDLPNSSSDISLLKNNIPGLPDEETGQDCVGEACCQSGTYFYGNTCNTCPSGMVLNNNNTCVLIESFSSFSPNPTFTPL